jgi:hypothetical protein
MSKMPEPLRELFKVSQSTGKLQVWWGWTEDEKVLCSWGDVGGKMQTKEYSAEGKNIGRSNETSSAEQATVELQAMYQSQVDNKHYMATQEQALESAEVCLEPRKVQNYKDHSHKLPQTCISFVKYNGSRGCIVNGNLYSKIGRIEDIKVNHIKNAVDSLRAAGVEDLDCEVYAHGLPLQRIRSAWIKPVKTNKEIIKIANERAKKVGDVVKFSYLETAITYLNYDPNEDAAKLKLHVFDFPDTTGSVYEERIGGFSELQEVISTLNLQDSVVIGEYRVTHSKVDRELFRDEVVAAGYEGLVHYDPQGIYEFGKRSSNTQKDKPRYDGECKVVGVTSDKNGEGVLSCITSYALDNASFKCKMKVERRDGERYERDFTTMRSLIGSWITFSYEELSSAGIPTKPVGEEERKCDQSGKPQE